MPPKYFVIFLKGTLAILDGVPPDERQTKIIAEKLNSCFEHVEEPTPKKQSLAEMLEGTGIPVYDKPIPPKPTEYTPEWWLDPRHGWTPPGVIYRC